ncbi:MAG: ATP-dependent zinc protease [Rhodothermales bacterium]
MKRRPQPTLIVGWREWVALPDLGLPAVKAKVDTGAKTSSLHAFDIETFREDGCERVRFGVHPLQENERLAVWATADVVDERSVTSSSGHEELRVVIRTALRLGDLTWPVEVTLTDRRSMRLRMLLGREALAGRLLVDASVSYLHGRKPRAAHLYT